MLSTSRRTPLESRELVRRRVREASAAGAPASRHLLRRACHEPRAITRTHAPGARGHVRADRKLPSGLCRPASRMPQLAHAPPRLRPSVPRVSRRRPQPVPRVPCVRRLRGRHARYGARPAARGLAGVCYQPHVPGCARRLDQHGERGVRCRRGRLCAMARRLPWSLRRIP
eukprot:5142037-Prymnesium_polylepis.1